MKKLLLVVGSALILGGCNLGQSWQQSAARDEKPETSAVPAQSPAIMNDSELSAEPSLSPDNNVDQIEKDLDNTKILDEDFSNLEI